MARPWQRYRVVVQCTKTQTVFIHAKSADVVRRRLGKKGAFEKAIQAGAYTSEPIYTDDAVLEVTFDPAPWEPQVEDTGD